jgi:hypothetical protein
MKSIYMGQFVIGSGCCKGASSIFLKSVPMTFIKSNNKYYKPHTVAGGVGASCQAGNLRAVKRRT